MSADPAAEQAMEPGALACALFADHRQRVYRHCLWSLRSQHDAEDAVQQTYVNAFRALQAGVRPRFEAPWLLQIARNVCLERRRSAARRARLETLAGPELLESVAAAPVDSDGSELRTALAALEPRQREALLLREWRGLSYREIATVLELSQSAVESLLFRARRSLARALEDGKRLRASLNLGALLTWRRTLARTTACKTAVVAACCGITVVAAPVLPHGSVTHHVRGAVPATARVTPQLQTQRPGRARSLRGRPPSSARVAPTARVVPTTGTAAALGGDPAMTVSVPTSGANKSAGGTIASPTSAAGRGAPPPAETAGGLSLGVTALGGAADVGVHATVGSDGVSADVSASAPGGADVSASVSGSTDGQAAAGASADVGDAGSASVSTGADPSAGSLDVDAGTNVTLPGTGTSVGASVGVKVPGTP